MLVHHVKYCSYVHVCELYTDCLKEPELGDQKPRLLYNGDIVHKEECPELNRRLHNQGYSIHSLDSCSIRAERV